MTIAPTSITNGKTVPRVNRSNFFLLNKGLLLNVGRVVAVIGYLVAKRATRVMIQV
jgi:hypothetical protein